MFPLAPLLRNLVRRGRLTVIDPSGQSHIFAGEPTDGLAPVTIRIKDPALMWRAACQPSLAVGEGYMDDKIAIEQGSLYDFLALAAVNMEEKERRSPWTERAARAFRFLAQWNSEAASRRNVAHHYDLSGALYSLFLDPDRQYSCAYFPDVSMTLEEAQCAKKRHLMAKLLLKPGQKVLDIGCGWGGLALSMARVADVEVTGITLSEEQLKVAQQRAEEAQLAHKVKFMLCDYRKIVGRFDRIVSVGMFEHVGVYHYLAFFRRIKDLLTDTGVALLHSIGRSSMPGTTNAWIRKYIFPGGYIPALSEVMPSVEQSGLAVTDIEFLHPHYADTLRLWRKRFVNRWAEASKLYDERFCRMWEFYLAGSECAFRHQEMMVFQMQLANDVRMMPRSRDYIGLAEQSYPRS